MANINNDSYFDGYYKDIWKTIIPPELTRREVEFMLPYFNLGAESKVLDLMCGYGRHALALGRKGVTVYAVDNLGSYVDEAEEAIKVENLPVFISRQNVLTYQSNIIADLAICMGNSLNFFDAKDTVLFFKNVSEQLKTGGFLFINTWSIAEIAIKEFKEKGSSNISGLEFLYESKYLFQPCRIETEHTIISPDGNTEIKSSVDYIFSVNEIEAMMQEAGFELKEIYSIPGRKKFTVGEPRAYIVAQKK